MSKPTALDPKKVQRKKSPSPHRFLSPKMGAVPSLVDIGTELSKNDTLSDEAYLDAMKLQYNLIDLFTIGEVQMTNFMNGLFRWKDPRAESDLSDMAEKLGALLGTHFEILRAKVESDIGCPLTWGMYNAAIRALMASFKEKRQKPTIMNPAPINHTNIGFVRVLMN
jgi:hypothetical protein